MSTINELTAVTYFNARYITFRFIKIKWRRTFCCIYVQIILFFSSSHFVYLLFLPKYIKSVKSYINSNPKRWWVNMSPNTPTMRDVGKNIFFPYRISSRLYGRCNICISFHKNYVFVVLKIHILR